MIHEPGIYYNMPESEYMSDWSLGSSSLKRLLISPLTYWVHSPHNPDRPDDEPTEATEYGTALHVRLLLGREAFYDRYAPKLDPDDYPEHLKSGEDLAARCGELGLPKSGTLRERSDRIRAADPDARLWLDVVAAHATQIGERESIPERWIANIELAAQAIEQDRETRERLSGGQSEVSLFWRDPECGTPLKARVDYLKDQDAFDLKSFANQRGLPLENAVASAMSSYGYGLQAVSYLTGLQVLTGKKHTFTFLFVNSGPAPNVLARDFSEFCDLDRNAYWARHFRDFRHAVGLWKYSRDRFGLGRPWVSPVDNRPFADDDFPLWAL